MDVTEKSLALILSAVRRRRRPEEVIDLVLEQSCLLANVVHGSFILVDYASQSLAIMATYGPDWTEDKKHCRLAIGQGITGSVAQTGIPYLCHDVSKDPCYIALFQYVKSELTVPVIVGDKVWGVINLDGMTTSCFREDTVKLVKLFAEMVAFAFTLQEELEIQQRMQQELMQSQKLASLGKIIAGIAHEINNPLTTILGHASMLEMNPRSAPDPASIHAIIAESQRAAAIVRTLLEFARKEVSNKQICDVNELVNKVSEIKSYQLGSNNIKLEIQRVDEKLPVEVSPQQIHQVLLNLVNNAEHAMPIDSSGLIQIEVGRQDQKVLIRVRDNGSGISTDVLPLIFDPFFTTKKVGEGTGLGLSMARSIMQSHGGDLYVEGSSSKGTCFVMNLPLWSDSDMRPIPQQETEISSVLPQNHPSSSAKKILGRVLVVDDEEGILLFVTRFLTLMKVQVTTASNGLAALEKLRHQKFDAVVSDIKMPGLTGLQLHKEAQQIDTRYRRGFIFMSGDFMQENTRKFVEETGCAFIEKPFTGQRLWKSVEDILPQEIPPSSNRANLPVTTSELVG